MSRSTFCPIRSAPRSHQRNHGSNGRWRLPGPMRQAYLPWKLRLPAWRPFIALLSLDNFLDARAHQGILGLVWRMIRSARPTLDRGAKEA
jgi:hypothetical protein